MVIKLLTLALGAGSVLLAAGGGSAASARVGAEVFNRRLGYKKGEGPLTKRHAGVGVIVHPKSPSEAGQCISKLESLSRFHTQYLALTESEGEMLEEMVVPLKALIDVRGKAVSALSQAIFAMASGYEQAKADADELRGELQDLDAAIEAAAKPIARMLDSIPSSRRRHIPGA